MALVMEIVYRDLKQLESIADIVHCVLLLERIGKNEKNIVDDIYCNVCSLRNNSGGGVD